MAEAVEPLLPTHSPAEAALELPQAPEESEPAAGGHGQERGQRARHRVRGKQLPASTLGCGPCAAGSGSGSKQRTTMA